MAHIVEGDWKNFTFKMISKDDFPAVSQHLRNNFYIDEVTCKLVGNSEAKFRDFDNIVSELIGDNLSFAAIDKDTGKIAAVRITHISKKDDEDSPANFESDEAKIILGFINGVNTEANFFEKFGIEEIVDFFIASVDSEYRCQGLASEMYQRSILLLKERNFTHCKSAFTSPFTRQIAKKHGFEELARRYYRNLQNLDGEFICPEAGEEEFVAVMALKL